MAFHTGVMFALRELGVSGDINHEKYSGAISAGQWVFAVFPTPSC